MRLSFKSTAAAIVVVIGLIGFTAPAVWAKKAAAKTTPTNDADAKDYTGKMEVEGGKPNANGYVHYAFWLRIPNGPRVSVPESLATDRGFDLKGYAGKSITIHAVTKETLRKGDNQLKDVLFLKIISIKLAQH